MITSILFGIIGTAFNVGSFYCIREIFDLGGRIKSEKSGISFLQSYKAPKSIYKDRLDQNRETIKGLTKTRDGILSNVTNRYAKTFNNLFK